MTRRGTPDYTAVATLAERTGLTLNQVEIGVELARSGRADVLDMVISGRMPVSEALTSVRRNGRTVDHFNDEIGGDGNG
jgi:hypothetical protein